ncbi:MAG TPA: (d)CMP kinase [Candidatus Cottocaccamicrobium excrementipullorum]|nr:(d)CMP kinase [Candidatus Cottocaccamicrobium excrementipullorum]
MQHFNIAIDGPAGAGKSTIAKMAAERLGFIYVDTGAMYRGMALYFLRQGISPSDEEAIKQACSQVEITIRYENGVQQIYLNGENVSSLIRREEVGNMASATSVYPAVREKLVELQRQLAAQANVIMDGRDIGTCVLPHAQVKIFLTASVQERAKRRYLELKAKGEKADLQEIRRQIEERDDRDTHRENSPLVQAEDAVYLDTSSLDIQQAAGRVLAIAAEKGIELPS